MAKVKVYLKPLDSKEEGTDKFKHIRTEKGNFGHRIVRGKSEKIDEIEYYEA